MSNRAIELSLENKIDAEYVYNKYFINALAGNNITLENEKNKMYMKAANGKIYSVDLDRFAFLCYDIFVDVFESKFPKHMQKEYVSQAILDIFMWFNPIFDNMSVSVKEAKDECFEDFKQAIVSDIEYYNIVRTATINQIRLLNMDLLNSEKLSDRILKNKKRKDYIDRFISLGVLTDEDKIKLQYYAMYSSEDLKKLFEDKQFSSDDRVQIISQAIAQERENQPKNSSKKEKIETNTRILNLVYLLSTQEVVNLLLREDLTMYSAEMLKKLFEDKQFSSYDRVQIIGQAFIQERKKQQKSSDKKSAKQQKSSSKKVTNTRIIQLVNLASIREIIELFLENFLTVEEFSRTRVTKKDLLNEDTPYDILLEILNKKNNLLPESLKITSRDLLNEYGKTRNGNEIFELAKCGYIEPQDLIEVYEINQALRITGYNKPIFEDDQLRDYYTPNLLVQMKGNNKISPNFIQRYLELFDFEHNPEVFRERSQALVTELEKRAEENSNIEDDVLYFFDNGLCDVETAKSYVSEEYIENKYVNNEISIEKVIEYNHLGLISDTAIANYYSDQEIIELYENGTLSGKCLRVIRDTGLLMEEFVDGNISDEDFIMTYLHGNLSVNDLSDAIQISEKEINISCFIDKSVSVEKIKELFLNYLIDNGSLLDLHNQEIIDDKEFEDIKKSLNIQKFFDELSDGRTYKVVTSRENLSIPRNHGEPKRKKDEDTFSAEMLLISKLLGKNVERETPSRIESYNSEGKPTSLNNYRIFVRKFGNEDSDGIIILQKSEKENAVYVMSGSQLRFFLHGKENDDGEIEIQNRIQNRIQDKAYLRTITGVEVVEHSMYFARHLVEAAARVSPEIAKRLKEPDGIYKAEVEKMVEDMRRTYIESKLKERVE